MQQGKYCCSYYFNFNNFLDCEIKRQISIINLGKEVKKQTLKYNTKKNITIKLRDKENSEYYRYIPDPDLPEIVLSKQLIRECKNSLQKHKNTVFQKYLSHPYKLPPKVIEILIKKYALDYFEKILENLGDPANYSKTVGDWIVNKLLGQLNIRNIPFQKNPVKPDKIATIIKAINENRITVMLAKSILQNIIDGDTREICDIIKSFNYEQASDSYLMLQSCQKILSTHKEQVEQYKSGKNNVMKWILGKVIKETQGRFPVLELEQLLKEMMYKNDI